MHQQWLEAPDLTIATKTVDMEIFPDLDLYKKHADLMHGDTAVPDILWNALLKHNGDIHENELDNMPRE